MCGRQWGGGVVTICPTYITSNVELRENKVIPSNVLRNLQSPMASPESKYNHDSHHSTMYLTINIY